MKGSSATSARATASPRSTGPSSGSSSRPSRAKGGFLLAGPSDLPDPESHAYRPDLADAALAGRVIASHYAEPVERVVVAAAPLRTAAAEDSDAIRELAPGERFDMLDDTAGWAWGYAGEERRVGYVRSEAIARS